MSNIELFDDVKLTDIFDANEKIIKVMIPSPVTSEHVKKITGAKTSSFGFLYSGIPIYFDKTTFHVAKENKKYVDELIASTKKKFNLKEELSLFERVKETLRKK